MKSLGYFLVTILTSSISLFGVVSVAQAENCYDLLAGKNQFVGEVCVSNDANTLTVTYETANDWIMDGTQLVVGSSLADIPVNRAGNPVPGHFPYGDNVSGTFASYQFNLAELGLSCSDLLVVAAKADVSRFGQSEGAWSAGQRITPKGNWATWSAYQASCPNAFEPNTPYQCEDTITAYAFGSVTLKELEGKGNNWGWQIGPVSADSASSAVLQSNDGQQYGSFQYSYGSLLVTDIYLNPGYMVDDFKMYVSEEQWVGGGWGNLDIINGTDIRYDSGHAHFSTSVPNASADQFIVVKIELCPIE